MHFRFPWPSRAFWLLPLLIGVLRTLPYLCARFSATGGDEALLEVGYVPADFLSYVAFIRQASVDGGVLLENPYTTEVQDGRFILLLHTLLGWVARITGASPTLVLELSRIPLTFGFFAALWWFVQPIFDNLRDRYWAVTLVGLSGGVEGFFKPLMWMVSEFPRTRFTEGVWHLYGWNTFEALYNPLWIAGLILMLLILRPAMQRERLTAPVLLRVSALFLLLHFIHPYSSLATLGILAGLPIAEAIFSTRGIDWLRQRQLALALAVPLLLILLVSRWQAGDLVYRAASSNVLGKLQLAVFWYPLTLGCVGVLALRGAQLWTRDSHPYRYVVLGWIAAVMFLHTSPIINGYHFVYFLHLPLCLLAAPAARRIWDRFQEKGAVKLGGLALIAGSLASFLLVTAESIGDIQRRNRVPKSFQAVVQTLAQQPSGHVLAPPQLGNMIPAYTPHRVWVGHWFLTPEYHDKLALWDRVEHPAERAALFEMLEQQRIRYWVVARQHSEPLVQQLGNRLEARIPSDDLEILVLRRPEAQRG